MAEKHHFGDNEEGNRLYDDVVQPVAAVVVDAGSEQELFDYDRFDLYNVLVGEDGGYFTSEEEEQEERNREELKIVQVPVHRLLKDEDRALMSHLDWKDAVSYCHWTSIMGVPTVQQDTDKPKVVKQETETRGVESLVNTEVTNDIMYAIPVIERVLFWTIEQYYHDHHAMTISHYDTRWYHDMTPFWILTHIISWSRVCKRYYEIITRYLSEDSFIRKGNKLFPSHTFRHHFPDSGGRVTEDSTFDRIFFKFFLINQGELKWQKETSRALISSCINKNVIDTIFINLKASTDVRKSIGSSGQGYYVLLMERMISELHYYDYTTTDEVISSIAWLQRIVGMVRMKPIKLRPITELAPTNLPLSLYSHPPAKYPTIQGHLLVYDPNMEKSTTTDKEIGDEWFKVDVTPSADDPTWIDMRCLLSIFTLKPSHALTISMIYQSNLDPTELGLLINLMPNLASLYCEYEVNKPRRFREYYNKEYNNIK